MFRQTCLIVASALPLVFASGAFATTLYGSRGSGVATADDIFTYNQTNGAITVVGTSGDTWVGDLTSNNVNKIWGTNLNTGTTPFTLVTINPITGAASDVAQFRNVAGAPVPIVSLAFDA